MKTKDLMIGDWVVRDSHKNNPVQVLELHKQSAMLKLENGWCGEAIDLIEPILLTPDILEKNGFKHYATYPNEDIWMYMLFDPEIEVIFTEEKSASIRIFNYSEEDDGKEIINLEDNGKPRYVHELQHALRLCGLNDLADNFKI